MRGTHNISISSSVQHAWIEMGYHFRDLYFSFLFLFRC